ncbi:hypothetical protein PoB_007206500 [Plakobranchus ocellatus]|uniref:Uncharacterized protein n=1 Tax=Plakobranchus ocellatus TaxID=259542 RepID=A0AAV4DNQ9_9GAST|nr:hypothetical protein PoB_007206500 [Plakobranchus ocellatus]
MNNSHPNPPIICGQSCRMNNSHPNPSIICETVLQNEQFTSKPFHNLGQSCRMNNSHPNPPIISGQSCRMNNSHPNPPIICETVLQNEQFTSKPSHNLWTVLQSLIPLKIHGRRTLA